MRISDWSSDVCSADLALAGGLATVPVTTLEAGAAAVGEDEFGGRAPLLVVLDAKRSDLYGQWFDADGLPLTPPLAAPVEMLWQSRPAAAAVRLAGDRKSTRLNSSH